MLADQRAAVEDMGAEERNTLAEDPHVREMVSGMMAKHWDHWVEQPIPVLGDRTPMEAVKDRDGREKVKAIVMQAERGANGPDSQTDPEAFRRLRERLGLSDMGN